MKERREKCEREQHKYRKKERKSVLERERELGLMVVGVEFIPTSRARSN